MIILYPAAALAIGFALDALLGDPPRMPHIIRLIGRLIAALEYPLRHIFPKTPRGELLGGAILAVITLILSSGVTLVVLIAAYRVSPIAGIIIEGLICYQLLAARCLRDESSKVKRALESGDITAARYAVSMIVGRDTDNLDEAAIARAAVETVAENASDGVIAPMLYIAVGGAALGCLYKAVNTLDSMVGYKNERYLYFGRVPARLDDAFGYIPSRLAALLMILAAPLLRLDMRSAYRIWRRDRLSHASPNSAQTESVCAGALGIRLAGPAQYFGVMHDKPYIGDGTRPVASSDIAAANRLMYVSALFMLALSLIARGAIYAAI